MNEKKLGVIGGLGPKATAYFYNLIVDNTKADVDQDHIDAIYLNHASMPDRTRAILFKKTDELKGLLIEDAKLLESLKVSHIAIPCNTSHSFYEDIQNSVNIPVINMIDETIKYIISKFPEIEKIGILATNGTREMRIYDKYANSNSVEIIYPSTEGQDCVMRAIYDGVKAGKEIPSSSLDSVIEELKSKGCKAVVLGCTELSVIFHDRFDSDIVDPLRVLAYKSIEMSGKQIKYN